MFSPHNGILLVALVLGLVAGILEWVTPPQSRAGHVFGWFAVAALALGQIVGA